MITFCQKLILALLLMTPMGLNGQHISGDKPVVYFFLLEECVICQSYSQKINSIVHQFDTEFEFVAVFPSFISKPENIRKFLKDYDISLPFRTDYYKDLTKKFGVSVTPEVVVYKSATEKVLYKGRIDNEFVSVGRRRRSGINDDLMMALNQIKSGINPDPASTQAVGCFINMEEMNK
jgi:thiol-disulfide isomerase/thioredoxin